MFFTGLRNRRELLRQNRSRSTACQTTNHPDQDPSPSLTPNLSIYPTKKKRKKKRWKWLESWMMKCNDPSRVFETINPKNVFGLDIPLLWVFISNELLLYWVTIQYYTVFSTVVPGLPPFWCYEWNHDGLRLSLLSTERGYILEYLNVTWITWVNSSLY